MSEYIFDNLDWFRVKLVLVGLTELEAKEGLPDLQELLDERSYLKNPQVWWDPENRWLVAEITLQADNVGYAAIFGYDNFWDTAFATIEFAEDNNSDMYIYTLSAELIEIEKK